MGMEMLAEQRRTLERVGVTLDGYRRTLGWVGVTLDGPEKTLDEPEETP